MISVLLTSDLLAQVLVWLATDLPWDELYPDVHGPRDHVGQDSLGLETLH